MWNKMKNMYYAQTLLLFLSIVFTSCKNVAQEEGVKHKTHNTELPFKFDLRFKNYKEKDSSYVFFYIPREFTIKNNFGYDLSIRDSYWSDRGGNTVKGNNIYYDKGKFQFIDYPIKLEKRASLDFKIYTRLKKVLSYEEVEFLEQIFNVNFEEKKTYQTEFTPELKKFLITKIPLKGFTRFRLYNSKTKKNIFHNVPFDF